MTVAEIDAWLKENPQQRVAEMLAAWTPGDLH
jgi:membrane-bound lytic murein transglycosylase